MTTIVGVLVRVAIASWDRDGKTYGVAVGMTVVLFLSKDRWTKEKL